jgi:hypothetical protein
MDGHHEFGVIKLLQKPTLPNPPDLMWSMSRTSYPGDRTIAEAVQCRVVLARASSPARATTVASRFWKIFPRSAGVLGDPGHRDCGCEHHVGEFVEQFIWRSRYALARVPAVHPDERLGRLAGFFRQFEDPDLGWYVAAEVVKQAIDLVPHRALPVYGTTGLAA